MIICNVDNKILRLRISDNGKGYSKSEMESKDTLGIELISEMVTQLNGSIQINSTNGTENIIDIPL